MISSLLNGFQHKILKFQKKLSSARYHIGVQTSLIGFIRLRTVRVSIVYCNFGKGGIDLDKISDEGVEGEYDECVDLSCLIHFQYGKSPVTFYGDL